jgi:PhzF family phenazine biosynthesis protein
MRQRIVQVDAFTDRPFAGNPAAVCVLEAARDASWMQSVAREMNLAETAFLVRRSDGCCDYDLRWFTPAVEVDLCGHATLASAHVLWEEGHLAPEQTARFHTRSGLLTAIRKGALIELDFPAEPAETVQSPSGLSDALGARPVFVGKNRMDYLVEVESAAVLRQLRPDFGALARLPVRGIIVTSVSDEARFDFLSRFFGPSVGVDEDPATGSSHCCLAPYWQPRLNKSEMTGYQASARGGNVQVRIEGERVKLGGQAVTVLRGELTQAATN